ncbi:MAG: hypothetical protein IPM82_13720 [Saprospiraceae bacterium]|nr:hypothetical protein [Saprospiraceae bacterium]
MQTDIKKVLAYSTVSQLGLMFMALGLGAYTAAIFHVITHAFFKALLFLGSGSIIHAMSGEQDIRLMGGLRKKLPITYRTFLIGTLAISGIPPLAGFFSKDQILASALEAAPIFFVLGLGVSLMTAFYMFRLLFLTFFGEFRGTEEQRHHLHESPAADDHPARAARHFVHHRWLDGHPARHRPCDGHPQELRYIFGTSARHFRDARQPRHGAGHHGRHDAAHHCYHLLRLPAFCKKTSSSRARRGSADRAFQIDCGPFFH